MKSLFGETISFRNFTLKTMKPRPTLLRNFTSLFRKASHSMNPLHIPDLREPSVTACRRRLIVEDLVEVALPEDRLIELGPSRFCRECVTTRPDRFPHEIVEPGVAADCEPYELCALL